MSVSPSVSPEPVSNGFGIQAVHDAEPPAELQQDQEEVENAASIYPAPPNVYKRFTNRNLALAKIAKEKGSIEKEDLVQGETVPSFDLTTLVDPPNIDWIVEEGKWSAFGQEFYVRSVLI